MTAIGPYIIDGKAVLAPMAGVTDWPFRQICAEQGAALVTGEMTSSNPALRDTLKSRSRTAAFSRETSLTANPSAPNAAETPRIVQIAGTEPQQMAEAAEYQVAMGAQIVDINMGCPAKKVCKKLAGSSLLKDETLVKDILETVVKRVEVPVTLKIRTGWDARSRNAVTIAKIAEQAGIASLAVHGRTRACKFRGCAEYDTIAEVVDSVSLPVFANGDIDSAIKAREVLDYTGASGLMIGRAALGNPWIFSEINKLLGGSHVYCALFNGKSLNFNDAKPMQRLIIKHLQLIEHFYRSMEIDQSARKISSKKGEPAVPLAVRVARKHICWYFDQLKHIISTGLANNTNKREGCPEALSKIAAVHTLIDISRARFNRLESHNAQLEHIDSFFRDLPTTGDIAA